MVTLKLDKKEVLSKGEFCRMIVPVQSDVALATLLLQLRTYENRYGMTSLEALGLEERGLLPDTHDHSTWLCLIDAYTSLVKGGAR